MKQFTLLAFTNPVAGREDEYNEWYSNRHLDDVLKVPGIRSAQRFRRSATQRDAAPYDWDYLAVYQCEANDVQEIFDGIRQRAGTAVMPISDALHQTRFLCVYEPVTDMKRAKD